MISRYDALGRYLSVGSKTIPHPDFPAPVQPWEVGVVGEYDGAVDLTTQYHDIPNNRPVDMPPKPSPHHDFDYRTKQWVANTDKAWAAARQRRSSLLMQTDWRVTKALETGDTLAQDWLDYRQALRDITLQTDPLALVWPVEPG